MKATLIKTNQTVGMLYEPDVPNRIGIVYASGAPGFGEDFPSEFKMKLAQQGYTVFVPDYIGSGRSEGEMFTFDSCLETLRQSEALLTGNTLGKDMDGKEVKLQNKLQNKSLRIIGSSFGGHIVPFYFGYNPGSIIEHVYFSSAVLILSNDLHDKFGDESDEAFLKQMNFWGQYFRQFEKSDWQEIYKNANEAFDPIKNVELLKGKSIDIVHGKKDDIINYKRAQMFSHELEKKSIAHTLHLVEEGGHAYGLIKDKLKALLV